MFALIHMDWTLNRRLLLQFSPIFLLWTAVGVSHGMQSLLGISFAASLLAMALPVLQNLRDTVEPFICALPVSRRQIVLARYLSASTGMMLSFGFFFLLGWVGHGAGLRWASDILPGDLLAGMGLQALLLSAGLFLYLPFHFRFGGDLGLGLFTGTLLGCLIVLFAICGWQGLLDRTLLLLTRMLEERAFASSVLGAWGLLGVASLGLSLLAYPRRISRRPLSPALPLLLMLSTFLFLGIKV